MPKSLPFASLLVLLIAALALATAALAAERVAPTASGSSQQPPKVSALPAIPENADEIQGTVAQPPLVTPLVRQPAHRLTPMMTELLGYLDARDQAMTLKRKQLAAAKTDAAATLALQAELQQMKQDTELEMLRIQFRWAQKEGRTADAQQLAKVIDGILHPVVPVNPEKRPAPTVTPSR